MSRIRTHTFESGDLTTEGLVSDSDVGFDPTIGSFAKSGLLGLNCTTDTTYKQASVVPSANDNATRVYSSVAIKVVAYDDAAPPQVAILAEPGGVRSGVGVNSTGKMVLYTVGTLRATGSVTLTTGTWFILQLQTFWNGASSLFECKLYDSTGTSLLETLSDATNDGTHNTLYHILRGGSWNNPNKGCYYDNWAVNNSSGGADNSYPDPTETAGGVTVVYKNPNKIVRPRPFMPGIVTLGNKPA